MRVCIINNHGVSLTETFIRAHYERLPGEVSLVHGWPPVMERPRQKTQQVLGGSVLSKVLQGLEYVIGGASAGMTTVAYRRALKDVRPDVILAEYGFSGVAAMEAARQQGVPLVVHFHGYDAHKHSTLEEHREGYARLFKQAAAIVAVSRRMKAHLIELGAPAEKVFWNPCGVDADVFALAAPAEAAPTFLTVGRFVEKKAPHLTLLAFAELRKRVPNARLRMAGEGSLLSVCQDLAVTLGLSEAVTLLGPLPHEQIGEEMSRARAFVQHSVVAASGDSEGTPVSVLEAGAAGLPVIATRHAGIPDVVVDGETGLLCEERDVESMVNHMEALALDAEKAERLGRAARRRIRAHFSMSDSINRLHHILRIGVGTSEPTAYQDPVAHEASRKAISQA